MKLRREKSTDYFFVVQIIPECSARARAPKHVEQEARKLKVAAGKSGISRDERWSRRRWLIGAAAAVAPQLLFHAKNRCNN